MNADFRNCSSCLNYENGICSITGSGVKLTDRCSFWDDAEDDRPPMKVRSKKIQKKKKKVSWE